MKVSGPKRKAWNYNSKHLNKKHMRLFDETMHYDIEFNGMLRDATEQYKLEMNPAPGREVEITWRKRKRRRASEK